MLVITSKGKTGDARLAGTINSCSPGRPTHICMLKCSKLKEVVLRNIFTSHQEGRLSLKAKDKDKQAIKQFRERYGAGLGKAPHMEAFRAVL